MVRMRVKVRIRIVDRVSVGIVIAVLVFKLWDVSKKNFVLFSNEVVENIYN